MAGGSDQFNGRKRSFLIPIYTIKSHIKGMQIASRLLWHSLTVPLITGIGTRRWGETQEDKKLEQGFKHHSQQQSYDWTRRDNQPV